MIETTHTNTEEIWGVWVDGKTIYKKTFYFSNCGHDGTTITQSIGASVNVDVVRIDAVIISQSSGQTWPMPAYWNDTVHSMVRADHTNIYVNVWADGGTFYDSPAYVTIYYTKASS